MGKTPLPPPELIKKVSRNKANKMEQQKIPKGCAFFTMLFVIINFLVMCYGWYVILWPFIMKIKNYLWSLL